MVLAQNYSSEASFYLIHPKKNVCACARVLVWKTLILALVWGTYYVPATYVPGISRQTTTVVLLFFPYHLLSSFYSLPPSRNSDSGSHSRLFFPPTHYGSCLAFFREKISALSSLVDSHRIVLTRARCSQQLTLFFISFYKVNLKSHHGGIRTHEPTVVTFESYD